MAGNFFVFMFLIRKIFNKLITDKDRFFYFSVMMAIMNWIIQGFVQTNINEYLPWFLIAIIFTLSMKEKDRSVGAV